MWLKEGLIIIPTPYNKEYNVLDASWNESLKELIDKNNEALSLIGSAVYESIYPRISVA